MGASAQADPAAVMREIRSRHPRFIEAVLADARVTCAFRGERDQFRSSFDAATQAARLIWVTDAFLAHVLYRAKARLQSLGVPILPRLLHRLAIIVGQVSIGDPVVMHPGVYIVHGQVVIDGITEIHSNVVISPWVTIGLRAGNFRGPRIGEAVHVGTGAKVIGPVTVGAGAQIGANAVVVGDVGEGETVVGAPARPTGERAAS
jgi:serine O-acetyltransferase